MSVCAVILAGGKGSRSTDPNVPKVAQIVGGKSLLDWHLDLLRKHSITDIIIVTGHLAEQVDQLIQRCDTSGLSLNCVKEIEPRGTLPALKLAVEKFEFDTYLVMLGDVLVSMPVSKFLNEFEASQKCVGVVVHPSAHPEDSDTVFESWNSKVRVIPKGGDRTGIPNMASAGLFAIRASALKKFDEVKDIGSDLLYVASRSNELFVFVSSHYLKDAGTPDRLLQANTDVTSGHFDRRGDTGGRRAIILDRDGVVNAVQPEVYRMEQYLVTEGVVAATRDINLAGIPIFIVTNQPGIAKGLMTFEDHEKIRSELDRQMNLGGAFLDDYLFCPHHPDAGFEGEIPELKVNCFCRKPSPGMAKEIEGKHGIDLVNSIVIGDTERDHGLARAIGASFIHVSDECTINNAHDCVPNTVAAMSIAARRLTC